jgi:hypothetical protein
MAASGVAAVSSSLLVPPNQASTDEKNRLARIEQRKQNINNNCFGSLPTETSSLLEPVKLYQLQVTESNFLGLRSKNYEFTQRSNHWEKSYMPVSLKQNITDLSLYAEERKWGYPTAAAACLIAGLLLGVKSNPTSAEKRTAVGLAAAGTILIPITIISFRNTAKTNAALPQKTEEANKQIQKFNNDCVNEYNEEIRALQSDKEAKKSSYETIRSILEEIRNNRGSLTYVTTRTKQAIGSIEQQLEALQKPDLTITPQALADTIEKAKTDFEKLKVDCKNEEIKALEEKKTKDNLIESFKSIDCASEENISSFNEIINKVYDSAVASGDYAEYHKACDEADKGIKNWKKEIQSRVDEFDKKEKTLFRPFVNNLIAEENRKRGHFIGDRIANWMAKKREGYEERFVEIKNRAKCENVQDDLDQLFAEMGISLKKSMLNKYIFDVERPGGPFSKNGVTYRRTWWGFETVSENECRIEFEVTNSNGKSRYVTHYIKYVAQKDKPGKWVLSGPIKQEPMSQWDKIKMDAKSIANTWFDKAKKETGEQIDALIEVWGNIVNWWKSL